MPHLSSACLVCTTTVLAFASAAAADQTLVFADIFWPDFETGSIRSVNRDGQGLDDILSIGNGLRAVALDTINDKIYWVDVNAPAVRRCNLDGSGPKDIVLAADLSPETMIFPSAIAVDAAGGKIYWGDQVAEQMWSANLDGSSPALLLNTPFHRGIALDTVNGKVYWSTSDTPQKGKIRRCNLDGSSPEDVISSAAALFKPDMIALDVAGGKIYWTDSVVDVVRRANLNNTQVQDLFPSGGLNPRGITLDLEAAKVYFGQDIDFKLNLGSIVSMDLDGAGPQTILNGADGSVGLVNSIALLPAPQLCPADIDGNNVVDVDDLIAVILGWGPCDDPKDCPADIAPPGGNDAVDVDDLIAVILAWGPCS